MQCIKIIANMIVYTMAILSQTFYKLKNDMQLANIFMLNV